MQQDGTPEIRDLIQRMHTAARSVADAPVEISDDDSKYDLFYLGEKMAQISLRLEGCSGLQTNLQIYKIELVARLSDLDHAVDLFREQMQRCSSTRTLRVRSFAKSDDSSGSAGRL